MAQGGDLSSQVGKLTSFPDVDISIKHNKRGLLSMANCGPDTNSTQFLITFNQANFLDEDHVVLGELVQGNEVLEEMENMATSNSE